MSRVLDADQLIVHIEFLKKVYNVGFLSIGDALGKALVGLLPIKNLESEPIAELLSRKSKDGALNEYFIIKKSYFTCLFLNDSIKKVSYPLLALGVTFGFSKSIKQFCVLFGEHMLWGCKRVFSRGLFETAKVHSSLRKQVQLYAGEGKNHVNDKMAPLRQGR